MVSRSHLGQLTNILGDLCRSTSELLLVSIYGMVNGFFFKYFHIIYWHYWRKSPPPRFSALLEKIPPLFDLKLVYSYVVEVADSESDLGLHGKPLVSEIFAFYHLLEYARDRLGRRGHVNLGHNFSIQIFFSKIFNIF